MLMLQSLQRTKACPVHDDQCRTKEPLEKFVEEFYGVFLIVNSVMVYE